MTPTWASWTALAIGSGVSAGIANQLLTWLRDHFQRSFQRDQYLREIEHQRLILSDQRHHEALLRAEQAHYEARPLLLPHARNVHYWLYATWIKLYGGNRKYALSTPSPQTVSSPADVLSELGEIAVSHPTADVRNLARKLDAEVDERYNSSNHDVSPSQEALESWLEMSRQLIDKINDFPDQEVNIVLSSVDDHG